MTPRMNLPVEFTPHAVERYRERLRPALSMGRAGVELQEISAHAEISWKAPKWIGGSSRQDVTMFLTVGDAAFPIAPAENGRSLVALTCLVKGSFSSYVRKRKNDSRRNR